ncbi:MAG: PP2C family protein-serine/threonine phosphatase [Myxococcota bacterium]
MSDRPANDGLLSRVKTPATIELEGPFGVAVAHVEPSPERDPEAEGQDAAAMIPTPSGLVLAVADGVGGVRGGAQASGLAVRTLHESLIAASELGAREAIMDTFDQTDATAQASPSIGSTTLLVVEVNEGVLRTYNTGDSEAVLVGGRGKIKLRTVAHSPVGYQVAAGILDDVSALHHELRHYITNVVGSGEMRIDVGPRVTMAARDTLVMGSDGLFDNVSVEELAAVVNQGPLLTATESLIELVRRRMEMPAIDEPSKPDDLSLVLYRQQGRL